MTNKTDQLYFNPNYLVQLKWNNKYLLSFGTITPNKKTKISQGLRDLSGQTIRYRFMGPKKEFSQKELQYLTELDGWNHFGLGLEESVGHERGVAIIRMVRSIVTYDVAEVAIVIIDEYQNIGLGKMLIEAIILAASEREIKTLAFSFLPGNTGILKLIQTVAPCEQTVNSIDLVQYVYKMDNLDLKKIKESLALKIPHIANFPL